MSSGLPDSFFALRRVLGAARYVVSVLGNREFLAVERTTNGRRFSAAEARLLVAQQAPWPFEPPPSWGASRAEVVLVGEDPEIWRVRLPVWSDGRSTDVVVTVEAVALPEGGYDASLEAVETIPGFAPGEASVAVEELAMQDAFNRERREDSRRHRDQEAERLRQAPPPDLPAEIAAPLARAMRDLVDGRYEAIEANPLSPEDFTVSDMADILEESVGRPVLAPQVISPGTTLVFREGDDGEDDPDEVIVEVPLWNEHGPTQERALFVCSRPGLGSDFVVHLQSIGRF